MSADHETDGNEGGQDPRFILALAANELGAGDFEEALARVRRLKPLLGQTQDLLAPCRALEARALASLGQGDEALGVLVSAIEDAKQAGADVHVRGLLGLKQKLEEALEMRRLAEISPDDIERQTPDAATRAVLFSNKIMALLATAEVERAKALLPRARKAAEDADDPAVLLPVLLATAQLCVATEDARSARKALDAARALAVRFEPDTVSLIDEMKGFLMRAGEA